MLLAEKNSIILAAAGSSKTELIVQSALAVSQGHVLISTYTNENQLQIVKRIEQKVGCVPRNVTILGWFSFLISQCAKPYQRGFLGQPFLINGLNFKAQHQRGINKSQRQYFLDSNCDMYRDGVSDFVNVLNERCAGAIIQRLEKIYSHIFIDEIQDLVGFDLDVLELLMQSSIRVTAVGDPRQSTLSTNSSPRNRPYRGAGLTQWFKERAKICTLVSRQVSYRCHQTVCDFADALFPNMPPTISQGVPNTGHDGVFILSANHLSQYLAKYSNVVILRHNKNAETCGLAAINIGVSKGSTFDRVVVFPTKPMLKYLEHRDPTKLKDPERLYVAVTRARFSVAFVVPDLSHISCSTDRDITQLR